VDKAERQEWSGLDTTVAKTFTILFPKSTYKVKILKAISEHISKTTGIAFENPQQRAVGGGCINSAYVISDGQRQFFVKTNRASQVNMFAAEYDGLNEIVQSRTIKVPTPVCFGQDGSLAYLVMEYLAIGKGAGSDSIAALGKNLAAMHRVTQPQYGWFRDNTIGSTPQINDVEDSWLGFWRDKRLGFQLELVARNGYGGRINRRGELLMSKLAHFLPAEQPPAALLHGDLWSGNYSVADGGEPVIFDPAVYYGDREADIAMTELFGGFPAAFYSAYNEAYPLDKGYAVRKTLYNLYHILNHVNLFGSGYLGQAESMIEQLLSEV
jgi:fructosamine-3-kinase